MQKYTYLSITAILALGAVMSCDKMDDLTRLPEDKLTIEAFFKNESQCAMWFNSCYDNYLPSFENIRMNADDMLDKEMDEPFLGGRTINDSKRWDWSNLRHINEFFQYSNNCEDKTVQKKYIGLASFFRACEYFNKVKNYGDVPYYDTPIGDDDKDLLMKARDSRTFVMEKVMEDFDVAIENLPEERSLSKITKWSALAMKSRAALYEGTFEKYHSKYGEHSSDYKPEYFLNMAVEAARRIMDGGKYTLYSKGDTPYFDLFSSIEPKSEEVILARIYDYEKLSLGHKANFWLRDEQMGFTKRFINHYLNADGTRREVKDNATFIEDVSGRDSRLAQTVLCPGFVKPGYNEPMANDLRSCTGYKPVKFYSASINNDENKCSSDYPCIRYAEILLNYAEALAELGTITQDDLDKSVNVIKSRAQMPSLSLSAANADVDAFLMSAYPHVTKSAYTGVILEIRRERTIELVMEGFRLDDMIRWCEGSQLSPANAPWMGVYIQGPGLYDMDNDGVNELEVYTSKPTHKVGDGSGVINFFQIGSVATLTNGNSGNMVPIITTNYVWDENKDYLWPIPSKQLTLNHNLVQNPGW